MKNFIKGISVGVISTLIMGACFNGVAQSIIKSIDVAVNSVNIKVNGKAVLADNFIYDGRTYVQLRQVSEMLDKDLVWDGETSTVHINDKKPAVGTLPTKDIEDSKKPPEEPVNKEYKLIVNGANVTLEVPLEKRNEDFLVFYKSIADSMDILSEFNFNRDQTLTFKPISLNKVLTMQVDKKQYTFKTYSGSDESSSVTGELMVPPGIANGRYCIPLKQFVEIFDGTVSVDNNKKVITVSYDKAKNLKQLDKIETAIKINNDLYLYSIDLSKSVAIARDNTIYIHPEYLDGLLSINYNNYSISKTSESRYKGKISPTNASKYITYNISFQGSGGFTGEGYLISDDMNKNFKFRIKDKDDVEITRDMNNSPFMSIESLFNAFNIKFESSYDSMNNRIIISFENLKLDK